MFTLYPFSSEKLPDVRLPSKEQMPLRSRSFHYEAGGEKFTFQCRVAGSIYLAAGMKLEPMRNQSGELIVDSNIILEEIWAISERRHTRLFIFEEQHDRTGYLRLVGHNFRENNIRYSSVKALLRRRHPHRKDTGNELGDYHELAFDKKFAEYYNIPLSKFPDVQKDASKAHIKIDGIRFEKEEKHQSPKAKYAKWLNLNMEGFKYWCQTHTEDHRRPIDAAWRIDTINPNQARTSKERAAVFKHAADLLSLNGEYKAAVEALKAAKTLDHFYQHDSMRMQEFVNEIELHLPALNESHRDSKFYFHYSMFLFCRLKITNNYTYYAGLFWAASTLIASLEPRSNRHRQLEPLDEKSIAAQLSGSSSTVQTSFLERRDHSLENMYADGFALCAEALWGLKTHKEWRTALKGDLISYEQIIAVACCAIRVNQNQLLAYCVLLEAQFAEAQINDVPMAKCNSLFKAAEQAIKLLAEIPALPDIQDRIHGMYERIHALKLVERTYKNPTDEKEAYEAAIAGYVKSVQHYKNVGEKQTVKQLKDFEETLRGHLVKDNDLALQYLINEGKKQPAKEKKQERELKLKRKAPDADTDQTQDQQGSAPKRLKTDSSLFGGQKTGPAMPTTTTVVELQSSPMILRLGSSSNNSNH